MAMHYWLNFLISRRFEKVYLEIENAQNNLELLTSNKPLGRQKQTYPGR